MSNTSYIGIAKGVGEIRAGTALYMNGDGTVSPLAAKPRHLSVIGNLPATRMQIDAQDLCVTANQFQHDMIGFINKCAAERIDGIDTFNAIIKVPAFLMCAARLAFQAGASNANSATINFGSMQVQKILVNGKPCEEDETQYWIECDGVLAKIISPPFQEDFYGPAIIYHPNKSVSAEEIKKIADSLRNESIVTIPRLMPDAPIRLHWHKTIVWMTYAAGISGIICWLLTHFGIVL